MSFQEAVEFIKRKPKEADALAFESQKFFKSHPEIPLSDIPNPVLDGKTISEAYYYLREEYEDSQMREGGIVDQTKVPYELAATPLLAAAFLQRPKIMEDDGDYQKIEEKLKKEWLKNNPGKDFTSKEGIDYLYGSLDDSTKTSLRKETEEAFRNNPKFKKKVERYDKEKKKIYKNQKDDPSLQRREHNTQSEIDARLKLLKTKPNKGTLLGIPEKEIKKYQQDVIERVNKKSQDEFAQKHPEKTKIYFEKTETIFDTNMPGTDVITEGISGPPQEVQSYTTGAPPSAEGQAGQPSPPNIPLGRANPIGNLTSGGVKNLIKKEAVKTAIKGLLAAVGPEVLIALGVLTLIFLIVLVIVMSGAAPGAPPQTTPTPAL